MTLADKLQLLSPGLSPALLKHARGATESTLLQGTLYELDSHGSPYIASDLIGIARDPQVRQHCRWAALKALSSLKGEESLALLKEAVAEGLQSSRSICTLSIGLNRSMRDAQAVIRALQEEPGGDPTADDTYHKDFAIWAAGELAQEDRSPFTGLLRKATRDPDRPHARAAAWLALAKAGEPLKKSELQEASENSTDFLEKLLLGISGLYAGHIEFIEGGIHATQKHHSPVRRLLGHIYRDFRSAVDKALGESGSLLLKLLDRGDVGH